MLETYTYIFYTIFLLFCVFFSHKLKAGRKTFNNNSDIVFTQFDVYFLILIYTLVVGLRYNVGFDYSGYTRWFKELKSTGYFPVDNDFGFVWLNKFLVNFGFESYSLFIIIAFLQFFFLLLFLKRLSLLRSWYFYFYFTSLFFFVSMNAMRQTLAFLIFAYCIQIFYEKKYCKTFFIALFALSIHKTAIMVFILLPFLNFEWFKSVKIQIGLLFLSVFVLPTFFAVLLNYVSPIINLLGYGYYIENLDYMKEITDENKVGDGLSIFLFFFIDLFIIIFYNRLKYRFMNYNFIKFYNLYFIGLILSRIFADNFILARIADYFIFFRVVILSFLMCYVFVVSSKTVERLIKPIAIIICLGMLLFYYKAIYNNAAGIAPFQFYFDHD
ncbi:EpsG family protein [Flavobacterium branchiicola]|uniref:EpsG family protein n=1 Tax=Flavobacterium branchiicola TaxID=1114875 RepID=A0ABV9PH03_9FLAO|nr:EpsG family protein [Flavobacterium branchiicola]MBS7254393.1 EpsG family protein [Flavobacterium branchiicola]